MKTAERTPIISQAIDQISEAGENFPAIGFSEDYHDGFKKGIQLASMILKAKYLPLEKAYSLSCQEALREKIAELVRVNNASYAAYTSEEAIRNTPLIED